MLITKGANVNAKNPNGRTPLFNTTVEGSKETAEPLIAKGADLNAKDKYGDTPLHQALQWKRSKEIAELLISKGADVNARSDDGSTPLDYAEHETADLLRKHGAKTAEELKTAGN